MGAKRVRMGFEAELYLVGGTDESPTFTRMEDISEQNLELTRAEVDTDTRDSIVIETGQGKMTISITGKMLDDPESVGYEELQDSLFGTGTNSVVRIMALSGPYDENGVTGYAFDAMNYNWSDTRGLDNAPYKDFLLKPCRSDWKKSVVVTGGVPVLTDIA